MPWYMLELWFASFHLLYDMIFAIYVYVWFVRFFVSMFLISCSCCIPLNAFMSVWWLRFACCMLWCMLWWLECYDYNLRGFHQCIDWILALGVFFCLMGVGSHFGIIGLPMSSSSFVSRINPSFLLVDSICRTSHRRSGSVDCGEEAMNRILEGVVIKRCAQDEWVRKFELDNVTNRRLILRSE